MGHQVQNEASATLEIIEAHPDMAYAIANSLRQADKDEICAVYDVSEELLPHALENSLTMAVKEAGSCFAILGPKHEDGKRRIISLFGYGDFSTDRRYPNGTVWLVSTEELFENHAHTVTKVFLRFLLPQLLDKYGSVGNYVKASNTVHVRWLKRCGFKVDHRRQFNDESFLLMRKDHV